MQRWVNRVAMVTGASSGIGAAITYQLLDNGVNVVALARRAEQIEEAVNNAKHGAKSRGRYQEPSRTPGKLHARACDVTKEDDILAAFKWVKDNLGGADILINNAGLGGDSPLTDTKTDVWKHMLDVNVVGLSVCTREAVQSMRARGVDDGHVVHICSIVGHALPARSEMAMYGATKHAVRVLAEGLRKDFNASNNKIKISCVSPGFVKTGFVDNLPNMKAKAQELYDSTPHLFPEDIADAVLYCIDTPPHVQIQDIIVKPVGEKYP
ncbi:farnesol dehydrogenase [Anabrus simplex]|uniref:farnesol dehydrogenase n=1 Tax=Anabrus simplex TaxID=316456 RepID=UPI0035A358FD